MAEELRFAVKCRASRQRPVLKRQCSNCFVAPTYVPNGSEQPIHENGILHGLYDLNKSTSLEYHETWETWRLRNVKKWKKTEEGIKFFYKTNVYIYILIHGKLEEKIIPIKKGLNWIRNVLFAQLS